MLNLFLDPYILACPPTEAGREEFWHYIQGIIEWSDLKDSNWGTLYLPAQASVTLHETGSFPLWDNLKQALNHFDIHEIQPRDVFRLVNSLLDKLPTIEDELQIRDVLFDTARYDPTQHLSNRHPLFITQYQHLLLLICLLTQIKTVQSRDQIVITAGIEGNTTTEVQGDILDCEFYNPNTVLSFPSRLSGSFPTCGSLSVLKNTIDPVALWFAATTDEEFYAALQIYIHQLLTVQSEDTSGYSCQLWKFGAAFFESSRDAGFLHEKSKINSLLRACAETVLSQNMAATHRLRTGKGSGDPQKMRGRDGLTSEKWTRERLWSTIWRKH